MTRFTRDEKRTYPFTWMAIGGVFFATAAWAIYAEFVTRVPWQKDQKAFFDLEYVQAEKALANAKDEWEKDIVPAIKAKLDRKEEIEQSMKTGEYAQAKSRLAQLDMEFEKAELGKTFGASDLDEAYYYRNLAEYERDKLAVEVRAAYREAYAAKDPKKADKLCDAIYADPPPEAAAGESSAKMHHLETEIRRMKAHVEQIDKARTDAPAGAVSLLEKSRHAEQEVIERLEVEVKHQKRVEVAEKAMSDIDGPADPILTEKDPVKADAERKRIRGELCKGKEDTRSCIKWLKIEPVDAEAKSIEIDIAKRRRTLGDAELRFTRAGERAKPKFDPSNVINSLVGPFQIEQTVNRWMDYERDVDIESVDRCHTCHMGVDSGNYVGASIPREFRTHPRRSQLLAAHPIEKFGCTTCHQGQGRATDNLAHSGWVLEEHHGEERWHFAGDHYWEDPLLPIGTLQRVVIDSANDEFSVKINKGKWETVKLEHRSHEAHLKNEETPEEYKTEGELLQQVQEKLAEVVGKSDVKEKWHAVVRKIDNRIQIGVEANDPDARVPAKEIPSFLLKFEKPETGELLGWKDVAETTVKQPIQIAPLPPSVPVRGDGMGSLAKDGKYTAPRGDMGLQVPDDQRNRFISALPEVESGCFRCHQTDVDLRNRGSKAKYIQAKLAFQKAEAEKKKDPEAYKKAHDGSEDLPVMPADPAGFDDLAPTFAEGRTLFRRLNCTGCHILDNYPWDRNAGPRLDDVTSKVAPEWVLTWIRNPRGWRAKTRMPNLWPKPLDPASKRPLLEGSPEYTRWEAQMREETVAIAAYLVERSENPASRPGSSATKPLREEIKGYADVPDATAEHGKLVFEAYGCQGCHARSDSDAGEKLPEPWRSNERDHAPTLSNLANKTSADWIAYWVENPSRYWHGTKMPNLRLSRKDAASVGKYLASLKSDAPNPATVDKADVSLVTDAAKRAERVPCTSQGGRLMTRVECGEKLIANYGCFGCHQIAGYEKSSPIAPELGGFAKKDVTTLDFGYAIADHHQQTTETFATLKLDSPRIYRRDRIELKMGDYDLSPREIRALVTFLKGLVPARPKEEYNPVKHPAYGAALQGRQLVEDYNCRGCHVIEDRGGDIDAFRLAQLGADAQARAPYLTAEGQRVQPEWLFTFLKEPGKNGIRPWLHPEWAYGEDSVPSDKMAIRMPTFDFSNEEVTAIVRYFASWDGQEYPYQVPKTREPTQEEKHYALAHMLSAQHANCMSCHFAGEFPVDRGLQSLGGMAPNLNLVHKRLRPEWVKAWLLRPTNYLPYTKMLAVWATETRPKNASMWPDETDPFFSKTPNWDKVPFRPVTSEDQAELVRDFLFSLKPNSVWPAAGEEATSPLVTGQVAAPQGRG
ncbi:MAG: c-type cytochrome [Polyangiaceae bacterium]|nr:c-type cytochrome [Polyangiaceae bacterium]